MTDTNRRAFLGGLILATGGVASSRSLAVGNDGHALGYDVAPASERMTLVPRRTGDPVSFSTSLDKSPIKATSGGWARDITTKSLPIATSIAGAHLYLNPGGVREVPSLIWWNFPMAVSGNFDGSLLGSEVKRLSELSAERAPSVNLP